MIFLLVVTKFLCPVILYIAWYIEGGGHALPWSAELSTSLVFVTSVSDDRT